MTTDTSERGIESLICAALTGQPCGPLATDTARERPSSLGNYIGECPRLNVVRSAVNPASSGHSSDTWRSLLTLATRRH